MAILSNYVNSVFTDAGMPIQATITVYEVGTATKATIYSDKDGAAQANPFNTDAIGRFNFYAVTGEFYDVEVSGTGITTYKLEYVSVDIIGLGVDVRTFGAKGNGTADDTVAINAAIVSLINTQVAAKTDPKLADDSPTRGVLYFPPGYKFLISSPLLFESDNSTAPKKFVDNITVIGYGAELLADPSFVGVSRNYDAVPNAETLKAMMIFSPKHYGQEGGQLQAYNDVLGLAFNGGGETDLAGIWMDMAFRPLVKGCAFEEIAYGIKGRVVKGLRADDISSYKCNSPVYIDNDSKAKGYNGGDGVEGFVRVSKLNTQDCLNEETVDAVNWENVGTIHLVNCAEARISDITIFGKEGRGIHIANSLAPTTWEKWITLTNIEITEKYFQSLYLDTLDRVVIDNFVSVRCQEDPNGARTGSPVSILESNRMEFSNFIIDQSYDGADKQGGHMIRCTSDYCSFADGVFYGTPVADNTYAQLYFAAGAATGGSYNTASNCKFISMGGNDYKHNIKAEAAPVQNSFDDLCYFEGSQDVPVTGLIDGFTDADTTPSIKGGKIFTVTNTGATNITDFDDGANGQTIRLIFSDANTTIVTGALIRLSGAANWNPNIHDSLILLRENNRWVEMSRSVN